MASLKIYQVDAFSGQPFGGNPAGVCILEQAGDPTWMQSVAREMNLSETAFLVKGEDGYNLRWFTPAVEVDLCGHATLASAHILYERGHLSAAETARFHTRSGLLTARLADGWIELDFPVQPAEPVTIPVGLLEALGLQTAAFVGKNVADYVVEADSEQTVRDLAPDFAALGKIPGARGIIVTARASTPGFDFVSRFFGPAVGINEDPVTGSAHTALTPYWCAKLGCEELMAMQVSPRGGVLRLRLRGERVSISGQAVTVIAGDLLA